MEIKREKSVLSLVVIEVACAGVVFMVAGVAGCSGNSPGPGPGPDGGAGQGGAAGAPSVSCAGGAGGGPAVGGAAGTSAGGAGGAGGQGQPGCSIPSGPAGTWVEIPALSGQNLFHVTDAFAAGTDDLLFAGNTYDPTTGATTNPRLLRWTQGCWTVELTIPPSVTTPDAPSVHGSGPDDLWATASDLLYHRDAQGWTVFSDDTWRSTVRQPPSGGPIEFHRVRAAAANDFWIAASSNVLHWSGETWTTYNFDDPNYPNVSASLAYVFNDIWIDSTSNVWVVGSSAQVGNTMSDGYVHHFDGANWTHIGVGVYPIYAIWRGGTVLWLAQPTRDVARPGEFLTLRAFDGSNAPTVEITGVDAINNSVSLTNLFGRGANDVWAAGQDVAHFDGQSWSLATDAPAPARSGSDSNNTFVTGDPGSVWLVTPGPRFFRKATSP